MAALRSAVPLRPATNPLALSARHNQQLGKEPQCYRTTATPSQSEPKNSGGQNANEVAYAGS